MQSSVGLAWVGVSTDFRSRLGSSSSHAQERYIRADLENDLVEAARRNGR